jgi:hypothetical protein
MARAQRRGARLVRLALLGSVLLAACGDDSQDRTSLDASGQDTTDSPASVVDSALPVPQRDASIDARVAPDGDSTSPARDASDGPAVDASQPDAQDPVGLDAGVPVADASLVVLDAGAPDSGAPDSGGPALRPCPTSEPCRPA